MVEDIAYEFVDIYRNADKKTAIENYPWDEIKSGFKTSFNTEYEVNVNEAIKSFDADIDRYIAETAKSILDKKFSEYDEMQVKYALREILLSTFDQHWKEHLLNMDHIKEGINLRAYAQKDPLTEYKKESFNLFEVMKGQVKRSVVNALFTVKLYSQAEIEEMQKRHQEELEAQLKAHQDALESEKKKEEGNFIRRANPNLGRNDLCPCGSGKKFKQCHGANG